MKCAGPNGEKLKKTLMRGINQDLMETIKISPFTYSFTQYTFIQHLECTKHQG